MPDKNKPGAPEDDRIDTLTLAELQKLLSGAKNPLEEPDDGAFPPVPKPAHYHDDPLNDAGQMEAGLKLLMRDGAAQVAFHPRLSAIEYADLLERVTRADTKEDLRREMQRAAAQWGKELDFKTEIE